MKVQHKSETFRYGDTNKDHTLALDRVIQFWNDYSHPKYGNWKIDTQWIEHYSPKFSKDNPDRNRVFEGHQPDIAFWEWATENDVVIDQPLLNLVIEIDGESHDSKTRKISDGIFEKWIGIHYKGYVPVIRIQKRELVGTYNLACEELKQRLGEYIV